MTNDFAIRIITGDVLGTSKETQEAITMAVKALSMPSAQPEQRWIPCSERLPKEDGEYLVESTRGYEVLYYREKEKQFGLMVFNFAGNVGFVPKKVYEWMPIPGVEE